jgi:hypothetical protein
MMDKLYSDENNPETGFEREDLPPRSVYAFLIGLALFAIVSYFALRGFYYFLNVYETPRSVPNALSPSQNSDISNQTHSEIADHIGKNFPDPRLEENERMEINGFRNGEDKVLNSYGWADKPGGPVRIPIDRAMELISQRGLPTRPQTGAAPPSTVQLTREAAKKADSSQKAGQKNK